MTLTVGMPAPPQRFEGPRKQHGWHGITNLYAASRRLTCSVQR